MAENDKDWKTHPLWYVMKCVDPRINGDNYSEVYEEIYMIDTKENCMSFWNRYRRNKYGQSSVYYAHPTQINKDEKFYKGKKYVIHAGRKKISNAEKWEIQHGY